MNGSTLHKLFAAVAVCLTILGLAAWSAGLLAFGGNRFVYVSLLALGAALSGLGIALLIRIHVSIKAGVSRYFNLLCHFDAADLRDSAALAQLPDISSSGFLYGLASRVRQAMCEMAARIEEVEHVRRATDVRARRATAECQRIKAILAGLDDPVLAIDKYDELILANPSAESLLDIDSDSTEKRILGQLLKCQELTDLLTDTCHRESVGCRNNEIQVRDKEGQEQWYRVTARRLVPQSDNSGGDAGQTKQKKDSQGAVAVLRSIADQKALQRRNAEFVSSVSHEMKTPLAGIKAYVELLADGEDEDRETREEFLNVINTQADRLQRLVENLLNLARMEAGVVKVDKQSRPLNELLEEAVNVVHPSAEAKNINLVSDLSPMYLGVLADRDMLLQAAINLLSNAIKYTPEGGTVTLRSRMVDNDVCFEVEDNGVGLSEEDSARVFEKFYRVNKNKDMAPGTGLGLPLAKHIAEDVHGGSLHVASTLGQGSVFSIVLPGSGRLSQRQTLSRP